MYVVELLLFTNRRQQRYIKNAKSEPEKYRNVTSLICGGSSSRARLANICMSDDLPGDFAYL